MNAVQRFLRRALALVRRARAEQQLDDELRFHLEMETAALERGGMAPGAARAEARRRFGARDRYTEECRDERGARVLEAAVSDTRYALRVARRVPGFSVIIVLTLGFAIGANTAMFSVINAVVFRPLPFPDPASLVTLYAQNPDKSSPRFNVSWADYLDWRRDAQSFADVAAFRSATLTIASDGEPERLAGLNVTRNFFDVLGVKAARGRLFGPDDERGETSNAVILSHGFWQRRFGSDPTVLERDITLSGQSRRVIGVLRDDFMFDGRSVDAVTVLAPSSIPGVENHGQHMIEAVARLKPGVTVAQAQQDLGSVAARLATQYADIKGWSANVFGFRDEMVRGSREPFLILLAAAGLVLLIGCINVANLLIARGATRAREIGLRRALGASRRRLVGQLLVESAVLTLAGGALGVATSGIATRLLLRLVPAGFIPRLDEVRVDATVLAYATGLSALTAVVVGLWPALRATGPLVAGAPRDSGRAAAGTVRGSRLRRALVVGEIALALVLVICSALVLQSLHRTLEVDPGFRAAHVVTMRLNLNAATYPDTAQVLFYRELFARLEAQPGIEGAAAANTPAISGGGINTGIRLIGVPERPGERLMSPVTAVTPGYFRTMGMKLLRGRDVSWRDARPTLLASESAARRLWPNEDPVGKRVGFGSRDTVGIEVIGLVGDTRGRGLRNAPAPMLYMSYDGAASIVRTVSVVVRAKGDAGSVMPTVRSVLKELDPALPVYAVQTVQEVVDQSIALPRLNTTLLTVFAVMALVLAAIGTYGVISYSVAQRTREIGVRMALGATRTEVFRLVLGEGAVLAGIGVMLGTGGAFLATPFIQSWLFGIGRSDPATIVGTALSLVAVALAASFIPARRATRVDPVLAIRGE